MGPLLCISGRNKRQCPVGLGPRFIDRSNRRRFCVPGRAETGSAASPAPLCEPQLRLTTANPTLRATHARTPSSCRARSGWHPSNHRPTGRAPSAGRAPRGPSALVKEGGWNHEGGVDLSDIEGATECGKYARRRGSSFAARPASPGPVDPAGRSLGCHRLPLGLADLDFRRSCPAGERRRRRQSLPFRLICRLWHAAPPWRLHVQGQGARQPQPPSPSRRAPRCPGPSSSGLRAVVPPSRTRGQRRHITLKFDATTGGSSGTPARPRCPRRCSVTLDDGLCY